MDWKQLYQTLADLFHTDACLQLTCGIWENDRFCSSHRFCETAHYCARQLRLAGLSQVELLPLRADGKSKYLDWTIPRSWDVEYAALSYADGELIADYTQNPCCLVMYSPATPAGGIRARVIVPDRDAPEGIRGSVLLVSDPAADWVDFAREHGALGILSDYIRIHPGVRSCREDLFDEVMWMGMVSDSVFGFHLTPRQGDEMRRRLKEGPVDICAAVSSRRYDGWQYTVSAALEGTDPAAPEVLLYGHLYEPGANDNACGAGAILHLAQILSRAVASGALPRPRRTIRFAMGHECSGSMGYFAFHSKRSMLCALSVDMVGTEAGDNATLGLIYNPLANYSFADGALFALHGIAQTCSGRQIPCVQIPFAITTDNISADPTLRCPSVAICAAPALSYHSSMDRPDRLEPQTLTRNALIAGTYAWGLATADAQTCDYLSGAIREKCGSLQENATHPRQKRLIGDAEKLALYSLGALRGEKTDAAPLFFTEPAPEYAADAEKRVPKRIIPGVLTFRNAEYEAAWNRDMNLPLFWVDGKRNLWQIAYLSAVEKGCCSDREIRQELQLLSGYFEALAQNGYLQWL